jgi:hypothetical protein
MFRANFRKNHSSLHMPQPSGRLQLMRSLPQLTNRTPEHPQTLLELLLNAIRNAATGQAGPSSR